MITVEQFENPCNCRTGDECWHNFGAERQALDMLVDAFAAKMKEKLHWKTTEGHFGWDAWQNRDVVKDSLIEHVNRKEGQWIDIANLAAMMWNFEQP